MNHFKECLTGFAGLFYPDICEACGEPLVRQEKIICSKCLLEMPRTDFPFLPENPVSMVFWGRINVSHASALFRFQKGSCFQELLHKLKYKGGKEIGIELGRQLGLELMVSPYYHDIDVVVPVPLHPKKERKRGYNQAAMIAQGISMAMGKPLSTGNLIRKTASETQTRKSRIERWQNVSTIFAVKKPDKIKNRHMLLVDDVITTGATLEACARVLLDIAGTEVSIATLAVA